MSDTNFTQKLLRLTFALGGRQPGAGLLQGSGRTTFGGGGNTVTLDGLRASANITYSGIGPATALQLRVWGMQIDQMNALSSLGIRQPVVGSNQVLVEAGTATGGFTSVFDGTIQAAWFDAEGMPDVVFNVQATMGGAMQVKPVSPLSYQGGTDVANIMSDVAAAAGLSLENNGVQGIMLADPYLPGTAAEQARRAAGAAGIYWVVDRGALAIWPRGGSRGGDVPLVSPTTGMVGYPEYTAQGIGVRTLYDPAIKYGGKIRIQSDLPQANGEWVVYGLTLNLESMVPGGNWTVYVDGYNPGFGQPPAPQM